MKRLVCEMCGGTDLIKDNGVFVCQNCGCKYSIEEARKMMVEGVVEVKGTVSIETDQAIAHNLELARTANESGNYAQAETYADKVIGMDSGNLEAWFIKGHSANYQSTYGNDRLVEALNCYVKVIEGIASSIDRTTPTELELLSKIRKDCIESCEGRSKLHGKAIVISPDDNVSKRVKDVLETYLEAGASALQLMSKVFQEHKQDFIDAYERAGLKGEDAESLWEQVCDPEKAIGRIYYMCGLEIFVACGKSKQKVIADYNENCTFDYYGDPRSYNFNTESRWLTDVRLKLSALGDLLVTCSSWFSKPACEAYFSDMMDTAQAAHRLMSTEVPNLPSSDEQAVKALDSAIGCMKDSYRCRTQRRYHNSMDSGRYPSGDGVVASDSYIKTVNDVVSHIEKRKADIAKEARARKQERMEAAKRAKEEANRKYWEEHAEEKMKLEKEIDAAGRDIRDVEASMLAVKKQMSPIKERLEQDTPLQAEYRQALKTVRGLEEERDSLGIFKRKEKKQLEARISQEKTRAEELKKQTTGEHLALEKEVAEALKPYESQLSRLKAKRSSAEARRVTAVGKLKADH